MSRALVLAGGEVLDSTGRRRADVVVVSDYAKGVVGAELLGALAEEHARAPFTWVVDPKRANFGH
ncbi:MAG: hypothetical protein ACRDXC_00625, partial [Acidimicrobiales bacterium]